MSGQGSLQAASMRNVIAFAREVRIRLRDSRVIFASVVASDEGEAAQDSFVVRPWGVTWTKRVLYKSVARVAPVRRMSWLAQRNICAMQAATLAAETP